MNKINGEQCIISQLSMEAIGILDLVPIGACILRKDLTVLFWNRLLETWTNIPREQIVGCPIHHIFPHFAQLKYIERLKQTFEIGVSGVFSAELHPHLLPARREDGRLQIQHTTVTAVPIAGKTTFNALLSIQDVTDYMTPKTLINAKDQHEPEAQTQLTLESAIEADGQPSSKPDLEQQIRQRTEELQRSLSYELSFRRITEEVWKSLNEDYIMQVVVEELGTVLKLDCCRTATYSSDYANFSITHEYSADASRSLGCVLNTYNDPGILQKLLQGETVQFCTHLNDVALSGAPFSVLACPIVDEHTVLGDLWLCRSGEAAFDDLDIRFAQQVTKQCAIALHYARDHKVVRARIAELETLNRLKDDILSSISHELRTPLSSIKISAQVLSTILEHPGVLIQDQTDSAVNHDRIHQCLNVLLEESDRQLDLVSDLLTLQQVDANDYPLVLCPLELQTWIPTVVETFQERTHEHQHQWTIDLPSELPAIDTDVCVLNRILAELLTNACKFSPIGSTIAIAINVAIGAEHPPLWQSGPPLSPHPRLQIRVTNPSEIPPDQLEMIFNLFYRLPSHDPRRYSGTGIGLALIKKLATLLGGSIWAASSYGQTCFTLEFPLDN
ncbi:ATP-binding protein [Pantanalinema rosaneae CENA516]|uniref:ATP-binding protein n=1 Tax=Pantanalinema rosaneae TaxID=1620701 RepID=UPI003D6DD604